MKRNYSVKERRAYWMGIGASLSRNPPYVQKRMLTSFNDVGTAFRNGYIKGFSTKHLKDFK